jgi:hypothetical protein
MELIATSHATSFIESFYRLITKKKLESILKKYTSGRGAPANLALILASAIIAQERLLLGASQDLSSIRISFAKVREHLDVIWFAIKSTTGIVSEEQQEAIVANILRIIRREVIIPPRRSRSCTRALRQPTKKWKRLFNPISNYSPLQLEIISAS